MKLIHMFPQIGKKAALEPRDDDQLIGKAVTLLRRAAEVSDSSGTYLSVCSCGSQGVKTPYICSIDYLDEESQAHSTLVEITSFFVHVLVYHYEELSCNDRHVLHLLRHAQIPLSEVSADALMSPDNCARLN